jgi:hypothetical protein
MKTFTRFLQLLVCALISIFIFFNSAKAQTGTLTGVVTNCVTGDPVIGAKVTWGYNYTYTTTGGLYSMTIYPTGTYNLIVAKIGYNIYTIPGVTVTIPGTTTVNVLLNPQLISPANVTATLNPPQTAAVISWNTAMSNVELMYDDMGAEQCLQYYYTGSFSAVKFTPCGYPAVLNSCKLSLCGTPANFVPFNVYVYNANGPGGMPGTTIAGPFILSPTVTGWINLTFPSPINITGGSFYIAMEQGGDLPNCAGLSVDTTTNQLRSFQKIGTGPWVLGGGNYLIHAVVNEPCGLVPPSNITYTVSRLKQGEENNPAAWVQVGSVTGINTITDNSWSSLSCGAYRWGVKATYPCNGSTSAAFSNVIGKCWTANVTFHGQKCCDSLPKAGFPIQAHNLDVPDTNYFVLTDTSGTAVIHNMWKGHYQLTSLIFGCSPVTFPVTISGDTTINIIMTEGPVIPPYGLIVSDTTLFARWYKPSCIVSLLDERWTSGSFVTNAWTTSGGSNWNIDPYIGQPVPSAEFYWVPEVVNYNQYLTSKTITGENSPILELLYDIYLDNFATTTVNSMALEIWDGSTWNVLKTYDNSGGSIPWKSEVVDITPYTAKSFKFRFHAYGVDSYDINNWNIDNIKVNASIDMPCLLGYTFSLNNILEPFLTDTFCQIPPDEVTYGQACHACVKAVYSYDPGYSSPDCYYFTAQYLYTPLNFTVDSIECSAYLTWQKPKKPNGATPPGLIGYNIFKGDAIIHYCPSPDSLSYYDMNLDPGAYIYSCAAKYDLTVYGFPGNFAYSIRTNAMDTVVIICGDQLPFMEEWNQNNFTYYGWTFDPSQGNWNTTSVTGNPLPTADFSWSGKGEMKDVNYDNSLVGPAMDGSEWSCSHLFLDFDIKLIDRLFTSTEKMTIEILYDHTWHLLGEYVNNGSFGWITETFNIDSVRGKGFKIRFRAHGENTTNILHWYIDNIHVYGNCLPPAGLEWTASSQQVNLSWTAPCSSITGYNIFRSDSAGNPPFIRINSSLVTGTTFSDVPPGWSINDMYRYFITAIQMNNVTGSVLCETASDTVLVAFPTGIPEPVKSKVSIYPNPSDNYLTISSDVLVTKLELISDLGKVIYTGKCSDEKQIRLNTADLSQGIYFIRLTTVDGILFKKVVICR